jgi:hypothetical protein
MDFLHHLKYAPSLVEEIHLHMMLYEHQSQFEMPLVLCIYMLLH